MEEKVVFDWNVKEKPEDFIVEELATHQFDGKGQHYLYLLEKKNYTTQELADRYGFSYAGLKDKTGITRQYVSFEKFIGGKIEEKDKDRFYRLIFIGRIRKKVKLGRLKGNRFKIKLKYKNFVLKNWFINYYDTQRLRNNYNRGKELIKKLKNKEKTRKDLSWLENFLIDSYLSFIWNKSLEFYLKQHIKGFYIIEKDIEFFIPDTDIYEIENKLPKYWAIPGYKIKLEESKDYYTQVLKKEGFTLKEFISILKDLKIKGDYRKSYIKVEPVCINNGYISFELPKGSYATMFLKHIYRRER